MAVGPGEADQGAEDLAHPLHLLGRDRAVAHVGDRLVADTDASAPVGRCQPLDGAGGIGRQLAVVEGFGDEGADGRVEPEGRLQKEAEAGRHGRLVLDHVVERGAVDPRRVNPVRGLAELVGIAQQDQVGGRRRDREQVGQRHLAGLIHHQGVQTPLHPAPGKEPRGAGHHLGFLRVERILHL